MEGIKIYGFNVDYLKNNNNRLNSFRYSNLKPLQHDTFTLSKTTPVNNVSFRGMSKPNEYENTFDYMAASIIDKDKDILKELKGKPIGASKIKQTVSELFEKDLVFNSVPEVDLKKTKFPKGTDEITKHNTKNCIDQTREITMDVWKELITTNERKLYTGLPKTKAIGSVDKYAQIYNGTRKDSYFDYVKENPILKFIIWKSFMSDLSERNRHIPPPINPGVIKKTVEYFENLKPEEYTSMANGVSKFREKYQQELVNNAIECIFTNKNNEFSKIKTYDTEGKLIEPKERKNVDMKTIKGVWIELPKRQKDTRHPDRNIAILEQLSHPNWCTKSRSDMAETYLRGGSFLMYLEYDNEKNNWNPKLGTPVVCAGNGQKEIYRIQGENNDNIIPSEYVDLIEKFIQNNKDQIACHDEKADGEGEFAAKQIEDAKLRANLTL